MSGATPSDQSNVPRIRPTCDWVAVVNPVAGHGQCGRRALAVIEVLCRQGLSVSVRTTGFAGEGVQIVREVVAQGFRNLLAVGGDGTANEVVNGIAQAGAVGSVRFATLPLGTSNSFLRDFGQQEVDRAVAAIVRGDAPPCDLLRCRISLDGELREHWALNNIIVGFGANVGALMNRRLKFLGKAGYSAGVVIEVARLTAPRMILQVDGAAIDQPVTMVNVANSQFTGGNMHISPGALVDDGLFDVLIIERLTRRQLLNAFPLIFSGRHVTHPLVRLVKGRRMVLSTERPLPLLIDGDIIGSTPLEVEVVPAALRVIR
jgi:diacylglycerol kinase (ATP)